MDLKIFFAVTATIIGFISFIPYLRDILLLKTKPHAFTWLIWTITQSIAVFAILKGGGGIWGGLSLAIGTLFVLIIFLLSLKYGTKDITKIDVVLLVMAVVSIFVWLKLDNPIASIIMISLIDVIGYIPTIRKSYFDPYSETLSAWSLACLMNLFMIFSLYEYNTLTLTYLLSIFSASLCLIVVCLVRRRVIKKD